MHTENFRSDSNCRLTNPAKSEIGKIKKMFIENINTKVRELSSVNQWQDSGLVISWLKKYQEAKQMQFFMQFDIEEFYPLISRDLLLKTIMEKVLSISVIRKQRPL